MTPLLTVLSTAVLLAAQSPSGNPPPDARELIRKSVKLDDQNFQRVRNYTFIEHVEIRSLDSQGKVEKTERRTSEVIFLYGEPFTRLIEKDGKPLEGKEKQKEQEKFDKESAKRERMSESERRKKEAERRKDEEEARKFLQEIPEAYDFKILGEEVRNGRRCWKVRTTPRPGYRGHDMRTRMLPKMRGTLWIDQQLNHWVRAEAESLDTISFGLVLARVGKGAIFSFEQTRINDEVWLPETVHVRINARLALFKSLRQEVTVRYSDYRKFQTDTTIRVGGEAPARP